MSRRVRWVTLGAAVLLAALGLGQLLLPPYVERRVESRLERQGGEASVSVRSFPAVRLLSADGSSLRIRGRDLGIPLPQSSGALERLDGFSRVDVRLRRVRSGPFRTKSFSLYRRGSAPYRLRLRSSASAGGLASFAGSRLGPLGAIAGNLARGALPGGRLPLQIDARFATEDGGVRVVSGGGSVAGIPIDPLIGLFGGAIASAL
jgi:hypothetical protein